MILAILLEEVVAMFPDKKKKFATYNFTLGRFPGYWCFNVVNSWHKWSDKKLETHFYGYSAADAVGRFLNYVHVNKINVKRLANR